MTDEERKKLMAERAALLDKMNADRFQPAVQGGPSGAFVGEGANPQVEVEPAPKLYSREPSVLQQIAEPGSKIGMSIVGAQKGMSLVAPYAEVLAPEAPWAAGLVEGGGAVAGAWAGGGWTQGLWDATKMAYRQEGGRGPFGDDAPDGFMQWAENATHAGNQMAAAEAGNQLLTPVMHLVPFTKAIAPETAEMYDSLAHRMRSTYQEITGQEAVTKTWNPFKWGTDDHTMPLFGKTELDVPGVRDKLVNAGLDPDAARKVVMTGGVQPTELPSALWTRMQGIVMKSAPAQNIPYQVARSRLMAKSLSTDLGTTIAGQLAPDELGQVVTTALRGRVDTLNMTLNTQLNGINNELPPLWFMDTSKLKGSIPVGTPGNSVIQALKPRSTWEAVQAARINLASMVHDPALTPEARAQVKLVTDRLDSEVAKNLDYTGSIKYRAWAGGDDLSQKGIMDQKFVQGLMKDGKAPQAVANQLINNSDASSFHLLDQALKGVDGGQDVMNQVRSQISDRIVRGASDARGVFDPQAALTSMEMMSKGKMGRAFAESTLGPEYVDNLRKYSHTLNAIQDYATKVGTLPKVIAGGTSLYAGMHAIQAVRTGKYAEIPEALAVGLGSAYLVNRALMSPQAGRLLVKTAERAANGQTGTAMRLMTRVMALTGVTSDDLEKQHAQQNPEVPNMQMPDTSIPPSPQMMQPF